MQMYGLVRAGDGCWHRGGDGGDWWWQWWCGEALQVSCRRRNSLAVNGLHLMNDGILVSLNWCRSLGHLKKWFGCLKDSQGYLARCGAIRALIREFGAMRVAWLVVLWHVDVHDLKF